MGEDTVATEGQTLQEKGQRKHEHHTLQSKRSTSASNSGQSQDGRVTQGAADGHKAVHRHGQQNS